MERVAVITGATSGIGLTLVQRLVSEYRGGGALRMCLACRNLEKAESVRQSLLAEHPEVAVDLLQVDTSSPHSAIAAAQEIQRRYHHVDWLFCNAGIMPVNGLDFSALLPLTPSHMLHTFSTGGDLLRVIDGTTAEGLSLIFATNVFGHYLMIRQLEEFLSSQGRACHIIWTSSNSANRAKIDPSNIQGEGSIDPYAYSKRVIDLLSKELNNRLNDKGIYSHTTCPGVVMSQITYRILPRFVWFFLYPFFLLVRLCVTHALTMNTHNGSEALVWLAQQEADSLDHSLKYFSRATIFGRRYVEQKKVEDSEELCKEVYSQLEQLSKRFTTT